jgi:hypothetical protein
MSKFVGLKSADESKSILVNLDNIDFFYVEKQVVQIKSSIIHINKASTKLLLDVIETGDNT